MKCTSSSGFAPHPALFRQDLVDLSVSFGRLIAPFCTEFRACGGAFARGWRGRHRQNRRKIAYFCLFVTRYRGFVTGLDQRFNGKRGMRNLIKSRVCGAVHIFYRLSSDAVTCVGGISFPAVALQRRASPADRRRKSYSKISAKVFLQKHVTASLDFSILRYFLCFLYKKQKDKRKIRGKWPEIGHESRIRGDFGAGIGGAYD